MKYKEKVYSIDDNIGDARRDGSWALGDINRIRPYYTSLEKDVSGRRMRVYKNFKTIQQVKDFICEIQQDIKALNQ
jgi:hypothetical protein